MEDTTGTLWVLQLGKSIKTKKGFMILWHGQASYLTIIETKIKIIRKRNCFSHSMLWPAYVLSDGRRMVASGHISYMIPSFQTIPHPLLPSSPTNNKQPPNNKYPPPPKPSALHILFNPHRSPMISQGSVISPIFRWGNWDSARLCDFPKPVKLNEWY